jgi:putative transposase
LGIATRFRRKGSSTQTITTLKGNADTERMIRTMKEELFWLREWKGEAELSKELDKWIEYYNGSYLHSAHGYRTPFQAEEEYYRNHNSHKNAA